MFKVVVYVPVVSAAAVRSAIGEVGGGQIGNYSNCSFSTKGTGRFLPQEGAEPTIGEVGKLEEVEEERIEFVCEDSLLETVIGAIKKAHPYEMPLIETSEVVLK